MSKPFYQIKASDQPKAASEIYIYGDIGESWWDETISARDFVNELNALDTDEIIIRINSWGGSVVDGIAIYNAIKRHKALVTVEIDGAAVSIASLIAMAGDTVRMSENALMMIHAPWNYVAGNSAELREHADVLDQHAAAMCTSYVSSSSVSESDIMPKLTDGKDHWYTAAEALEFGLIHEISAANNLGVGGMAAGTDLSRYERFKPAAIAVEPPKPAAAAVLHKQELTMPENPTQAAEPVAVSDPAVIAAQALEQDQARRDQITAAFKPYLSVDGVKDLMDSCAKDTECDAAKAVMQLMQLPAVQPTATQAVIVEDESEKTRAAAVDAILARAGVAGVKMDGENPYRGYQLRDHARAALNTAGVKADGMDARKMVGMAFTQSTSDFPVLLEEAMHKTLQTAYAGASDTWRRFSAVGSVSDFRAHNRYRLGSLSNLDRVDENGEIKAKSIPDGEKAQVQADTVGNIINLTRKMIINDDLGAFIGASSWMGRAAARTIEQTVYSLLAENSGLGPNMADGNPLFHASRANIGAAGVLSIEVIEALRVKMAEQTDVSGNDFLDLRPDIFLCGMGSGGEARVLNAAEYEPGSTKLMKPNKVRGLFSDIVDSPRIAGTRMYAFADPSEAPVIEVSFLDGVQEPFLEMMQGFDVDGTRYKVRMDFGVDAIDYRGAVTATGA